MGHKTFADLLREYMRRIGMIEKVLAEKIGVTRDAVARYKAGSFKPRYDKAKKIAEVLHLTPVETKDFLETVSPEHLEKQFQNSSTHINKWANSIFPEFIGSLLDRISKWDGFERPVILLLNQAGWEQPPCREALLLRAQERFSSNNVLSIFPPACASDFDSYFADIAKQCGFEGVTNVAGFESALEQRLKEGMLLLLINRFEQIPELKLQEQLAGIIRRFSQQYDGMRVIVCGGQQLETLKFLKKFDFNDRRMSLVHHAEVMYWPELGKTEVLALCGCAFSDLHLKDGEAEQILEISGGHPELLKECLTIKQAKKTLSIEECNQLLSTNRHIWSLFTPYGKDKEAREKTLNWLKVNSLELGRRRGLFLDEPFIREDLLRELYWKNLLVKRDESVDPDLDSYYRTTRYRTTRLYWRCEAIRMAGRQVLE